MPTWRDVRAHTTIAAAYVGLALAHTYPMALRLGASLPGEGIGDNVTFIWNLWWMREALASSADSFSFSPLLFAPLGVPLVLHTHSALSAFVAATALAPLTLVQAQNLILILSLALNGFAAYLIALDVTRMKAASAWGGAIFVVAPAIASRLMGHYNLVVAWPLIFACWLLITWRARPGWAVTIALACVAALIPYVDYYYTLYFVMFVLADSIADRWDPTLRLLPRVRWRWVSWCCFGLAAASAAIALAIVAANRQELRIAGIVISTRTPTNALTAAWLLVLGGIVSRWTLSVRVREPSGSVTPTLRYLAVGLVVFAVLTSPLAVNGWRLWRSGDYTTQASALRSSPRGVDVATFVMGPAFNGIIGASVRAEYRARGIDPIESPGWLGLVPLTLAAIALAAARSNHDVRRWALVGLVFAIWSIGPYVYVLGLNTGMLMPQALARFVPIVNNARIPGRAMVLVALCISVLASIALARLAQRRSRLVVAIIGVLAVAEAVAAPLPLVSLPDVRIVGDLPRRASPATVLPVPLGIRDGFGERGRLQHELLYAQTTSRFSLVGGFVARGPRRIWSWYETTEPYRTLLQLSEGDDADRVVSCEEAAAGLRAAGVTHVIVDRAAASPRLVQFVDQHMTLRPVATDDRHTLFEATPRACAAIE